MIIEHKIVGNLMSVPRMMTGLNISVSGLTITISAGGVDNVNIAEQVITLNSAAYDRQVQIFLVKRVSDGSGDLWVDIYRKGRQTAPVPDGYEVVEELCWFDLPANTTDLASIDINVRRIT